MRFSIPILLFFWTIKSFGGLILPNGLTADERDKLLNIVAFATAGKVLSNPFPLGGYHGVEAAVQIDTLPTEDLSKLGNQASNSSTTTFPRVSIGKGLYGDIDLFFHFMPFNQNTNFSNYGGMFRWGFYETPFFPAIFSLALNADNTNIGNQLFLTTFGADLMTGLSVGSFSLTLGGGISVAEGRFSEPLNIENNNDAISTFQVSSARASHLFLGAGLDVNPFFINMQLDQYDSGLSQTLTSFRAGFRF